MYREEIIEYGKKLVDYKLTSGTGGNISIYDRDNDIVWITPSGIDYYDLKVEDIVGIDLAGNLLKGFRKPSSEWQLHVEIYKKRKDVNSIIHGHTIYSTVLSILREPLKACHYIVALAGREVRVCDYATYGSRELALNAVKTLDKDGAVLLANHGIVCVGQDISTTFTCLNEIEYVSKLYVIARSVGSPYILDNDEIDLVKEKFKGYGQKKDSDLDVKG